MTKEEKREYARQYYANNTEKERDRFRKYRLENIEKVKEARHKYYTKNAEKVKEHSRRYRLDGAEKVRETQRKSRIKNIEKAKEYGRKYRADRPEISRSTSQRRRARKKQAESTLTVTEWQKIVDDHFGRCHYCGAKTDDLHQEHKTPLSKGGGYTMDNIVPACQSCNSSKGTKDYKQFVKQGAQRLQLDLI